MRLTDFWERMDEVFGSVYAKSWARDFVLPTIGCTVLQAIDKGVETKEIWRAVCASTDVPTVLR